MAEGIRATVAFPVDVCPVASAAARADVQVESVARSAAPADSASVTEFSVEADDPPDIDATLVFSHGSTHRYRLTHESAEGCPCTCLGEFDCVVDRYTVRDGALTLVFHAADYDQLQAAVGELRSRFPDVDIRRLVRSSPEGRRRDSVFVDRAKLTARQLEAVETAYRMGYFQRPRRANATEVADALDIDPSTLGEHLAAAQAKLLGDVLEDG